MHLTIASATLGTLASGSWNSFESISGSIAANLSWSSLPDGQHEIYCTSEYTVNGSYAPGSQRVIRVSRYVARWGWAASLSDPLPHSSTSDDTYIAADCNHTCNTPSVDTVPHSTGWGHDYLELRGFYAQVGSGTWICYPGRPTPRTQYPQCIAP